MRDAGPSIHPASPGVDSRRGWRARLSLEFAASEARTRLVARAHEGPLVVQKPLYPEGDGVCQCIVVHPPGGIAGGDDIELCARVDAGAQVQLTTPGATRWYRNPGAPSAQRIAFDVRDGGVLEWLPQGTIVFDGVSASSELRVELSGTARYIGWDYVCLGRTESSERFLQGRWRQRGDIFRDGALIWSERMALDGNSSWLASPAGLNGAPVFGTFVAMCPAFDDSMLNACRALSPTRCGLLRSSSSRRLLAGPSGQQLFQPLPPAGKARHHGAHRHAGDRRDLLIGKAIEFPQHQRLAEFRREFRERSTQPSPVRGRQRQRLRPRRSLGGARHRRLVRHRRVRITAPRDPGPRRIPYDGQQPRPGSAAERFERRVRAQKCFLYNIFRVLPAAGQPARKVVGRRQQGRDLIVEAAQFLLRRQAKWAPDTFRPAECRFYSQPFCGCRHPNFPGAAFAAPLSGALY